MNVRSLLRVFGALALLTVLSGCAAAEEKNAPGTDYSAATGAGLDMRFSSDMNRSDYPDACQFIPDQSMRIITDTPMRSNSTLTGCAWSPGRAALPTVVVKFVDIGRDASSSYRRADDSEDASSLSLVGDRARIMRTDDGMTTRVDVVKANVFFRVEDRLTNTRAHNVAQAQRASIQVARLVAAQISSDRDGDAATTAVSDDAKPPSGDSQLANTGDNSLLLTTLGVLAIVLGAR